MPRAVLFMHEYDSSSLLGNPDLITYLVIIQIFGNNKSRLHTVQKHICSRGGGGIYIPFYSPFPTDTTFQTYCYFHSKCLDKLHSFVSPVQTFTTKTRLPTSIEPNHPHSLHIPLVRRIVHANSFFQRTPILWNRLQYGCFPKHY